eukprot:SAG31_NODE_1708_length_7482_cov_15.400108_5_plen_112_part_00
MVLFSFFVGLIERYGTNRESVTLQCLFCNAHDIRRLCPQPDGVNTSGFEFLYGKEFRREGIWYRTGYREKAIGTVFLGSLLAFVLLTSTSPPARQQCASCYQSQSIPTDPN